MCSPEWPARQGAVLRVPVMQMVPSLWCRAYVTVPFVLYDTLHLCAASASFFLLQWMLHGYLAFF